MYVRKNLRLELVWQLSRRNLLVFTLYNLAICFLYGPLDVHFLDIPWQPVAMLGTAVAFYIGFKSNGSYDRFWEGRQLWGGIVNASRSWALRVFDFVAAPAADPADAAEIHALHRRLVYRHLAWCHALRLHLRRQTAELWTTDVAPFLDPAEGDRLRHFANPPTHLLAQQSADLRALCDRGWLSEFRHVALVQTLESLFTMQGGCERLKNTPFPRQFAYFSYVFVWIFAALLPLGLVEEFDSRQALGEHHVWLMVPFSVLVSWVFNIMEVVGHTTENPFANDIYDVSMTTICRSIEIDLRELLGETKVPAPLVPVQDVLY